MGYDVAIQRLEQSTVLDLKGPETGIRDWIHDSRLAFPEAHNTASTSASTELYWVGPTHWQLRAPIEVETRWLKRLGPGGVPEELSIVLISDTLAFFRVSGPDASEILAIASPLDTHPSAFPSTGAAYTEAFGVKTLVVRRHDGFELAVDRSYADMTADCLGRARSPGGEGVRI